MFFDLHIFLLFFLCKQEFDNIFTNVFLPKVEEPLYCGLSFVCKQSLIFLSN